MKRTTKALARLGTLAVIAGSALSAPFAVGTASASVNTITVHDGTIGSNEAAGSLDYYTNDGFITFTKSAAADNVFIVLGGTAGYFTTTANQTSQGGNVTTNSATRATCPTTTTSCIAYIGDSAAESVPVTIVDGTDATQATTAISFNGLFMNGCPGTGLDTGVAAGVTFGTAGSETTSFNCATQGQLGTGNVVNVTVHYAANDPAGANTNFNLHVALTDLGGTALSPAVMSNTQAPNVNAVTPTSVNCTTDSSGNCTIAIVNPDHPPILATDTQQTLVTVTSNGLTGNYPLNGINATPSAGSAPTELVRWGPGTVTPTRVDAIGGQVIVPSNQDTGASPVAEPGDVIQGTFQVAGSCTPVSPNVTCDNGTLLAGTTVTVTVNKGFITPNCIKGGVTAYAECSFTTAPAAGVPVGNLAGSGTQSATFTTDVNGQFKASFAIAGDPGFNQSGLVPFHVTVASLAPLLPGDHTSATTCGQVNVDPAIPGGGPAIVNGTPNAGCPADGLWTTEEQPLNGGTAKYKVIPSLAQPNNTAIQTENNFTVDDTKTWNVPDVDRVDFVVAVTDQFTNLTQFGGSQAPQLAKTGVGAVDTCGGFSATSACTGGGTFDSPAPQPDGTYNQTGAVEGSYLNNLPGAGGQMRYQADTTDPTNPAGMNGAWPCTAGFAGSCALVATGQPGVGDGTQKDVMTWTPPTTTFASFLTGTPSIATYAAGNGAAQTDTLTLAFYNQLAQAVVTFASHPGSTVPTGTAVTVQATVDDQNGNPIVNQTVDALRSGANEPTCVPAQGVANGGNVSNALFTNTSGVAGYTFTCDGAGVSNVSMVVLGPGGTQLAQGRQAITFTGAAIGGGQTVEKPTLVIRSPHAHLLVIHATTHPRLSGVTVYFYKVINGLNELIGSANTGPGGVATLRLDGLRSGHTFTIVAKAVHLSNRYNSKFSKRVSHRVS